YTPPPPSSSYPPSLHDALPIFLAPASFVLKSSIRSLKVLSQLRRLRQQVSGRQVAQSPNSGSWSLMERSHLKRSFVGSKRERRRSEEHTSELQSRENLVCRLLL